MGDRFFRDVLFTLACVAAGVAGIASTRAAHRDQGMLCLLALGLFGMACLFYASTMGEDE